MAGDKVGVGEGEEEEEVEEAKVMAKDVFLGVEIATREVVIVMAIVIVVVNKETQGTWAKNEGCSYCS